MRKHIITLLLGILAFAGTASAQEVKWTASAKQIMKDVFTITIKGDIPQGFHIYDTKEYEVGANPTVITFDCQNGAKTLGKTEVKCPVKTVKDELLGLEIGTIEGQAVFTQNVRVSAKKSKVKIGVEWMMCSENSCMPIDDTTLEITLVR